jgi:hypothetical protein
LILSPTSLETLFAAVLAVEGRDHDLGREEMVKWEVDREFWSVALSGHPHCGRLSGDAAAAIAQREIDYPL